MKEILYKKENNLFQSEGWLSFQEDYGRTLVSFRDSTGIKLHLPFGKSFLWVQKGPGNVAISEMCAKGKEEGVIFVRVEPMNAENGEMRQVGPNTLLSGQASPRATQVVNITEAEEEILAQMKPKTRYNIRLAEKKGVTVKMLDNVDEFFDLLEKTASRDKGYAPHERAYYTGLINNLGKSDMAHIFIAEHEGIPLAAIMVSFFGEVATYLHGGFDADKRNLMAPYLCQWEAIKYARGKGCAYYDFWGVAETDDPGDPWAGITRFKEGFGGEKVIFPGTFDIIISPFWYNVLTFGARLRHIIKR
jgi:lipid II:glycine glycyltransferase (peptidoglycan interpeptide bridge formation enzyme)